MFLDNMTNSEEGLRIVINLDWDSGSGLRQEISIEHSPVETACTCNFSNMCFCSVDKLKKNYQQLRDHI